MSTTQSPESVVYQGQFGEFTINDRDRAGVIVYRSGLALAALSFVLGSLLVLWQGTTPLVLRLLSLCFASFTLGLGISLLTIHIYLRPLHRLLQLFWGIGTVSALVFSFQSPEPLAMYVYNHPLTLLGIGFSFAALTGIYFKEAFCFNRLETKFLTPLVPILLLGHLMGVWSLHIEQLLLTCWSLLFAIFALRKVVQPIPDDIGDKSVFEYLEKQASAT